MHGSEEIFLLSWHVFQKLSRDRAEVMIFWDRKSQNLLEDVAEVIRAAVYIILYNKQKMEELPHNYITNKKMSYTLDDGFTR